MKKSDEITQCVVNGLVAMGVAITSENINPLEIKFDYIAEPVLSTVIEYE